MTGWSRLKVKHHSIAHFFLIVILFGVGLIVFSNMGGGQVTSGLFIGLSIYNLLSGTQQGGIDAVSTASPGMVELIIAFIINLIIYYILATILIFLYNLVFGK